MKTIIKHDKPCTDHLGNHYPNIKSMCAHWHIRTATFSRRRTVYGMSLEEALTRPVKHNGGLWCTDHTGEEFRSRTEIVPTLSAQFNLYRTKMRNPQKCRSEY